MNLQPPPERRPAAFPQEVGRLAAEASALQPDHGTCDRGLTKHVDSSRQEAH